MSSEAEDDKSGVGLQEVGEVGRRREAGEDAFGAAKAGIVGGEGEDWAAGFQGSDQWRRRQKTHQGTRNRQSSSGQRTIPLYRK